MRQHDIVFGNFTCKFGEDDLLDHFKNIVLPAFTDTNMSRPSRGSSYYLVGVKFFENIGKNDEFEPAIAGQFVKDTRLNREQYLDKSTKELIKEERSIRSSPSSFFVLYLKDHKISYVAETSYAPDIEVFERTIENFIKSKRIEYIRNVSLETKKTIKKISQTIEVPSVRIKLSTDSELLEKSVDNFELLQKIKVVSYPTNAEIKASSILKAASSFREGVAAKKVTVEAVDNEGLDKEKSKKVLRELSKETNDDIHLNGKDEHGNTIKVFNNDVTVKSKLEEFAGSIRRKAVKATMKYKELVEEGKLHREKLNQRKIEHVRSRI